MLSTLRRSGPAARRRVPLPAARAPWTRGRAARGAAGRAEDRGRYRWPGHHRPGRHPDHRRRRRGDGRRVGVPASAPTESLAASVGRPDDPGRRGTRRGVGQPVRRAGHRPGFTARGAADRGPPGRCRAPRPGHGPGRTAHSTVVSQIP